MFPRSHPYCEGPCRTVGGFTLLEALITVCLIAVLATVAVPAMQRLVRDNARTAAVNGLVTSLHLARSEAVKRGTHVVLCPSGDGETCSGDTQWAQGWIVFVDQTHNHARDPGEPLVMVHEALGDRTSFDSGGRTWIQYQATGMAFGSTATFTYCDERGPADARAVILSNPGRPRISDKAADGGSLSCPSR